MKLADLFKELGGAQNKLEKIIRHYGKDTMATIAIEEMSEVIKAITKIKRYGLTDKYKNDLEEEVADALIYNLVLVGDGSDASNLKATVKQLRLESQVWFYGACYDEQQNAELIYNADLCVSPGNVGLTAVHSLTFGCPVITHNCFEWQMPEYEAIRSGVTGDFFKMNDVEDMARVISLWFAEKQDLREETRLACFKEIDTCWNPYYQMDVIKSNLKLK